MKTAKMEFEIKKQINQQTPYHDYLTELRKKRNRNSNLKNYKSEDTIE